jgi:hypothetical protein
MVRFTVSGFPQFFRDNYKIEPLIHDDPYFNVLSTQAVIVISVNSDSTLISLDIVLLERLEIMNYESSLPRSQEGPYPEATEPRQHT